ERFLDGNREAADAESGCERQRVRDASFARIAARHGDPEDILRAEGMGRDDSGDRAVDAAAEAEDGALETALREVVARAQNERIEEFLLLTLELRIADCGLRIADFDQAVFLT